MMRPLTFHNGARIEWCGWRSAPNQDLTAGWWRAVRKDGSQVVATTLGGIESEPSYDIGRFTQFRMFDLTVTDAERSFEHREPSEQAKRRALDRLREWLDDVGAA